MTSPEERRHRKLQRRARTLASILRPLVPAGTGFVLVLAPVAGAPVGVGNVPPREGLRALLRCIDGVAADLLDTGVVQLHGDPPEAASSGLN